MKIEFDMNMKLPGQHERYERPIQNEKMVIEDPEDIYVDSNSDININSYDNHNKYNNIYLAKRDKYLLKIEDEIELRRRFLLEKQKKLEKLSRQNHFLETVKQDYENYHNYIVEQKEGQIRAMNSIKQYVEDLIVSGKLTDEDIRQAKDDQREITNEVKKIREKINEIIGV